MRVMVFVKATKQSEQGLMPDPKLMADMGKFNDELVAAGIMSADCPCGGLKPTAQAARVSFAGKDRTVQKGPFGNVADIVSGYWIWNVKSLEEAIEWVKRCPNPMPEDSIIEIRPFYEMEDFANLG